MRCKTLITQLPGLLPRISPGGNVHIPALRPSVPPGVYCQPPEGQQVLSGLPGGGGRVICVCLGCGIMWGREGEMRKGVGIYNI